MISSVLHIQTYRLVSNITATQIIQSKCEWSSNSYKENHQFQPVFESIATDSVDILSIIICLMYDKKITLIDICSKVIYFLHEFVNEYMQFSLNFPSWQRYWNSLRFCQRLHRLKLAKWTSYAQDWSKGDEILSTVQTR